MFYETLQALCAERNLSVSAALKIMGMSSGNMTYWRKGKLPSGKALDRMSVFFGVPVDTLTKSACAQALTHEQIRWLHLYDLLPAEDKALAVAQVEQFVRARIGESPSVQNQI